MLIILCFSCQLTPVKVRIGEQVTDNYISTISTGEIENKLAAIAAITDNAVQRDSFLRFFQEWHTAIGPNTPEFIHQNDTIERVFAVFDKVFLPFKLGKLGDWEGGNDLNDDAMYAAVQNQIDYEIADTDDIKEFARHGWKDSIVNFRPETRLKSSQVLYLTTEYAKALRDFLGDNQTAMDRDNVMNPSVLAGESERHYKLIHPYIPIVHGHNGGWNIATSPTIGEIRFNKAMDMAIVYFEVRYESGEAILTRSGTQWSIRDSKVTGIE